MKVFVLIGKFTYDFETTINTRTFAKKEDAIKCLKATVEEQRKQSWISNYIGEDFFVEDIQDDYYDAYPDGYATHRNTTLRIEENEVE